MRNPLNNYRVCNPKLEPVLTAFPKVLKTDNGDEVVNIPVPDDSFDEIATKEFSLQSLINAGIDPKSMRVDTRSYNAVNDVPAALDMFSKVDPMLNPEIKTESVTDKTE